MRAFRRISIASLRLAALVAVATLGMVSTAEAGRNRRPVFPGIVLAAANDTDRVSVAWLPATDDSTPQAAIRYRVDAWETPGFVASAETLRATLVGETQTQITGLAPGTEYEIAVHAVDAQGRFTESRRTVSTLEFPVVMNPSVPLENAAARGLGEPVVTGTDYVFTAGPGAQPPTEGSILIGPRGSEYYLRRVDAVTVNGDQVTVSTSNGALDDAVDQFAIHSAVTLASVGETGGMSALFARALGLDDGADTRTWDGGILSAEEREGGEPVASFQPALAARPSAAADSEALEADVDLLTDVSFEPTLEMDLVWSGADITGGELAVRGEIIFDTTLAAEFTAQGTYTQEQELFERTYRSLNVVGGIPVYQEVTLAVNAKLELTAEATASATINARNSAFVAAGIRYDAVTHSWVPTSGFGFDNTVQVELGAKAGITGSLELVPSVEVSFYVVAFANVELKGTLGGTAEIVDEQDPLSPCFGLALDRFDVTFTATCGANVGVNLIFRRFPFAIDLPFCGPFVYPLFTLPQIDLGVSGTGEEGDPFVATASVSDGTNHPFDPGTATWSVEPPPYSFAQNPGDPLEATLECGDPGAHDLYFAGNGLLGPLALQCRHTQVTCPSQDEDPPPQPVGLANDNENGTWLYYELIADSEDFGVIEPEKRLSVASGATYVEDEKSDSFTHLGGFLCAPFYFTIETDVSLTVQASADGEGRLSGLSGATRSEVTGGPSGTCPLYYAGASSRIRAEFWVNEITSIWLIWSPVFTTDDDPPSAGGGEVYLNGMSEVRALGLNTPIDLYPELSWQLVDAREDVEGVDTVWVTGQLFPHEFPYVLTIRAGATAGQNPFTDAIEHEMTWSLEFF